MTCRMQETADYGAELLRAIGNPTRMQRLILLMEKELCVQELADQMQMQMQHSAISHQLSILRRFRIVRPYRIAKRIYCRNSEVSGRQWQ